MVMEVVLHPFYENSIKAVWCRNYSVSIVSQNTVASQGWFLFYVNRSFHVRIFTHSSLNDVKWRPFLYLYVCVFFHNSGLLVNAMSISSL